jgi:hypothetical protein
MSAGYPKMVIEWHEREHKDFEKEFLKNMEALEALYHCGLRKFYECPNMRAQKRLMQFFIGKWNLEANVFMLDGQSLTIKVEDIYFITILSHRGDLFIIITQGEIGMTIENYISSYCTPGTQWLRSQIQIRNIEDLCLKVVIHTITRIERYDVLHQESMSQMFYAVECLHLVIYD